MNHAFSAFSEELIAFRGRRDSDAPFATPR